LRMIHYLVDGAHCLTEGVTWLPIGFLNKRFYHRFAVIRNLSSPFVLGMDFMSSGAPRYLISDRGSPFVSELFDSVLFTLGSTHRLTTAYHPQTNATKRVNRTPKTAIQTSLQEAHDRARETLARSHARQKRYYDLRRRPMTYAVGDLVKVKAHHRSDAQSSFTAKLAPLFTGPLQVTQKLGEVNYILAKIDTGEDAGVFHVVNVQPFYSWDSTSPSGHWTSAQESLDETETAVNCTVVSPVCFSVITCPLASVFFPCPLFYE
uniref:Tf2-1-like SH3-like domain-containing protein n=1 Tax=Neolamprologus brichardi TaxID=32507 RepID=A0A3Q4GBM0_NEOBR